MTDWIEGGPIRRVLMVDSQGNPLAISQGIVASTVNQGTPGAQAWPVSVNNFPAAQIDALTDAELRATPVQVAGAVTTGGLTDAQLRATPVVTLDPIAYFASAAGGRVAFNIATAVIPLNGSGEQSLAALVNPANSGRDMVLDLGEFGSSSNATFRRYRNSIITPTGTPRTPTNTGGGDATSAALMYVGGTAATFTRSGGLVAKDAFVAAYSTYFTQLRGRSVLRPGQSLSWTIQTPQGGAFTASVYIEYYERVAE